MALPWERQEGESPHAFEAFVTYRDLGPSRSLSKAVKKLNKNKTTLAEWSSQWSWVERCAAWEAKLDAERRQATLDEVREMQIRHVGFAQSMQNKLAARLNTLDPDNIPLQSVPNWLEVAVRTERLSRDVPTDRVAMGYMTNDDADKMVASIGALLAGLASYVPEESRAEYQRAITGGIAAILGTEDSDDDGDGGRGAD